MSMMNDFAQGGAGNNIPNYQFNAPPPRGPGGAPVGVGG